MGDIYFSPTFAENLSILANYSDDINERLVESLRCGSIDAFNTIYSLYAKKILNYVAKATTAKEDAEDMVHDIFMSLWKSRAILRPDTNLTTLLFAMAYKRRVDFFRQTLKAPIYEDYSQLQNELTAEESSKLEYDDFLKLFYKALSHLPKRLQSLLILSRIKGYSNEEIALKSDISLKTVQNGISKGLKLLKEQLENLMRDNY